MTETAVAEREGTELVQANDEAAAAAFGDAVDDRDLQLPLIQITQQMSRSVTDGKVSSGHFFNNVSGKDYGNELEFIPAVYQKGRFYVHNRDKDDEQTFVANGPVAPSTWPEQYAGRAFADIEDAEEQWRERVDAGEIEWGKGPPIVTTHNFVGLAVGDLDAPARISFSRTSAPAAKKIMSVVRWSRKPPYNSVFKLTLDERSVRNKPFFVAQAAQDRDSSDEERTAANGVFAAVKQAGGFGLSETDEEGQDKPKATTPAGGVEV